MFRLFAAPRAFTVDNNSFVVCC